jgi:putative ABC transport system permease protein
MREDLKQAIRLLRKAPLVNGVIVLVLAVGIAGTVAAFSVVRAVVLKPLPYVDANRLVALDSHVAGADIEGGLSSYPDFLDWRAQAGTIERMGGYAAGSANVTGLSQPEVIQTAFITDDLLPMLGVVPIRGALFPPGADKRALMLVLVSESFWRSRLSSDPSAVGRALTIDGKAYTIAGVLPSAFQFPIQPDPIALWVAMGSHPSTAQYQTHRGAGFMHVIGRLRPGTTVEQAQSDISAVAARLAKSFPQTNGNRITVVSPMRDALVRAYRLQLVLLLAAAGAVLLITCANVATLLITRTMDRRRELAVRAALGAGRGRIARQLLTESAVLSVIAGAFGSFLAWWSVEAAAGLLPADMPRAGEVRIDGTALIVAAAVTVATGLFFGAIPALRLPDARDALRGARGSSTPAPLGARLMMLGEVAVSLVLLTTAALLTQSLLTLQSVDPGFHPEHVVFADLSLPDSRYPDAATQTAFALRLLETLHSLPGVGTPALGTTLPLSGADLGAAFQIEGRPAPEATGYWVAPYYSVSPAFFGALGIPLLKGRLFSETDTGTTPQVTIISASLATKYFVGEDPIGRRVKLGFGKPTWRVVVGIVGDVKQRELGQGFQPQFYTPFAQQPWPFLSVIARALTSDAVAERSIRRAIAIADPSQPAGDVKSMETYVERSIATPLLTADASRCWLSR